MAGNRKKNDGGYQGQIKTAGRDLIRSDFPFSYSAFRLALPPYGTLHR
jgi:hypothetical protein